MNLRRHLGRARNCEEFEVLMLIVETLAVGTAKKLLLPHCDVWGQPPANFGMFWRRSRARDGDHE